MVTTTFASPLGEILLAADGRGLTGLWFERQEHFGSTLLKEDAEYVVGHSRGFWYLQDVFGESGKWCGLFGA